MPDIKGTLLALALVLALVIWIGHGCNRRMEKFREYRQERQENREERWDQWREDRKENQDQRKYRWRFRDREKAV